MKRLSREARIHSFARSLDHSMACKLGTSYMVTITYPVIMPLTSAYGFRQKWRPSRLRILKTMCFSFYDQKTPSWNSELKEINIGNIRPRKNVDIEVLKATNCSLKS